MGISPKKTCDLNKRAFLSRQHEKTARGTNRHTPLSTVQRSHDAHSAKVSACYVYRLRYICGDRLLMTIIPLLSIDSPALISQIK